MLQHWKESITVSIYKKCYEIVCNNNDRDMTEPNAHKTVSNSLLSRLTPYVNEIIRNHPCGFRRNKSTTP